MTGAGAAMICPARPDCGAAARVEILEDHALKRWVYTCTAGHSAFFDRAQEPIPPPPVVPLKVVAAPEPTSPHRRRRPRSKRRGRPRALTRVARPIARPIARAPHARWARLVDEAVRDFERDILAPRRALNARLASLRALFEEASPS
jgi:hypothetical protein